MRALGNRIQTVMLQKYIEENNLNNQAVQEVLIEKLEHYKCWILHHE